MMRRSFFRISKWIGGEDVKPEHVEGNRAVFLCDNPEQDGQEAAVLGLVVASFWTILAWRLLGEGVLAWVFALPLGFVLLQLVTVASALVLNLALCGVFELPAEKARHVHTWLHLGIVFVIVIAADLVKLVGVACAVFAIALAFVRRRRNPENLCVQRTRILRLLFLIGHDACAVLLTALVVKFFLLDRTEAAQTWDDSRSILVSLLIFVFLMHAVFLLGTLVPNCRLFGQAVRRFWPHGRSVWLTIDDGVDPATTPPLLDLLGEREAKATFFVIGEKANRNPEIMARIIADGHQIANHTHSHPQGSWWIAFPRRIRKEIGQGATLFRSPVGMSNIFVHSYLHKRGIPLIGWSARGFDGVATPREQVLRKIAKGISPGAIVLLHDGYDPAERGYAPVDILRDVLDRLQEQAYECVIPRREQLLA